MGNSLDEFKKSPVLLGFIKVLVGVQVLLLVSLLVSMFIEFNSFEQLGDKGIPFHEMKKIIYFGYGDASFLLSRFSGLLSIAVLVLFLVWVYRANRNSRILGAENMRFTPDWAVGWFFIPIVNFWFPYQVMAELWKTSYQPKSWSRVKPDPLLLVWWILYVSPVFLASFAIYKYMDGQGLRDILQANILYMAVHTTGIVECVVFLFVVTSIHNAQMENYKFHKNPGSQVQ